MSQPAPLSIEDLLTWIDQSVQSLQVFVGPNQSVASSMGFEMMLCAAVASSIPGAGMCAVDACLSDEAVSLSDIPPPISPQRFVVQFQGALINGSGVIDRISLDEMVREAYQDELALRTISLTNRPIQVKYKSFSSDDLALFASGTWTQFVMDALAARYQAHLTAGRLEQSTRLPTGQDNKSSLRRM